MIFDCNYINDKAAIDKSSANDPQTPSKSKQLAEQTLMATLDENKSRDATGTGSYRLRRNQHLLFICLFVIILHSPRRGAQLSNHKPANHWWSWHLINIILYPCPAEISCPSVG